MKFANPGVETQAQVDSYLTGHDLKTVMLAFHQLEGIIGTAFSLFPGVEPYAQGDRSKAPYYNNVPWSFRRFLACIREANVILNLFESPNQPPPWKRPGRKFLDVGCGLGTKMFVAKQEGWDVHGIEINPVYAELAANVVGFHEKRVECCDGIAYDRYGEYDCIYFYTPCRNKDHEVALEQKIYRGARPGAIIISAFGYEIDRGNDIWCCNAEKRVYLKGTEADFDKVRDYYSAQRRRESA